LAYCNPVEGSVDVVVAGEVVSSLGEGSFFGEIGLLIEAKRTASIRAATYCDLFVLSKKDLEKVLKVFPEQKARIVGMAEERMTTDALRASMKLPPFDKISAGIGSV
jgi:CRP-like cAMP-binding protein